MILYIFGLIIIGYILYAVIAAAVKKGVKEALYYPNHNSLEYLLSIIKLRHLFHIIRTNP